MSHRCALCAAPDRRTLSACEVSEIRVFPAGCQPRGSADSHYHHPRATNRRVASRSESSNFYSYRFWHSACMPRRRVPSSGKTMCEKGSEILAYFLRNPRSVDTLEGVVRWRLLEEKIFSTVEDTRKVIEWLIDQKYLSRISTPGKDPLYGIDAQDVERAAEFLRNSRLSEGEPGRREGANVEVILKNNSSYLSIVTLNSGKTVHLAPNEASAPMDDLEVSGNAKVEKLIGLGQLSMTVVEHQR